MREVGRQADSQRTGKRSKGQESQEKQERKEEKKNAASIFILFTFILI